MSKQISGEPLTLANTLSNAPELLRNEVDVRITKLRPMATPVDQISRYAASRPCRSMTVDYYAVATRGAEAKVTADSESVTVTPGSQTKVILAVNDASIFEPSDTVMLPDSESVNGSPMVFYVADVASDALTLYPVFASGSVASVPVISAGAKVIRMGRAAAELDVQTSQYEALPEKKQNYCQIFKAQIEQSTMLKAANKEVGWTFSDQEEVAIYDMRQGMERSFLFGK